MQLYYNVITILHDINHDLYLFWDFIACHIYILAGYSLLSNKCYVYKLRG